MQDIQVLPKKLLEREKELHLVVEQKNILVSISKRKKKQQDLERVAKRELGYMVLV